MTEASISLTAPAQSRPSIKCWASAASKPTFPRYKLQQRSTKIKLIWSLEISSNRLKIHKNQRKLLWNKCFKTRLQLRNLYSMVFNFIIYTPPFLKHNNPGSIVFSNNICIKALIIHMTTQRQIIHKFFCSNTLKSTINNSMAKKKSP